MFRIFVMPSRGSSTIAARAAFLQSNVLIFNLTTVDGSLGKYNPEYDDEGKETSGTKILVLLVPWNYWDEIVTISWTNGIGLVGCSG